MNMKRMKKKGKRSEEAKENFININGKKSLSIVMAVVIVSSVLVAFMPLASADVTSFTIDPDTGTADAVAAYNATVYVTPAWSTLNITIPAGFGGEAPSTGDEIGRAEFWNAAGKNWTLVFTAGSPSDTKVVVIGYNDTGVESGADVTFNISYNPGGGASIPSPWDPLDPPYANLTLPIGATNGSLNVSLPGSMTLTNATVNISLFVKNPAVVGDYVFIADGEPEIVTITALSPTNLTAILNDDGTINVTWEGTLGAPYDIYITENYQAGFPDTPNVTEITNLTWRDANAPSYAHRYYRVGFGGIRNDNETVGKYDLSLYNPPSLTNLNLINPCVLNTSYIATATNLTSAIAGSTATSMWDSEIQKLVDWIPLYGGVGIDFAIDPGYAYWIDVPENTTWTINGSVRVGNITVNLYNPPGLTNLNLIAVGLNDTSISNATNLTSAIAGSTATSMWDSEIQKLVDWIPLYGGVGIDFAIDPGYGYWIDVPANTTWTHPQ